MITGFHYAKMPKANHKGIILAIVMGVIMVTAFLAIALLRTVSNHARLTHHQVSRIQAQYAIKAAVVYALDKLRTGAVGWTSSAAFTRFMCKTPWIGCSIVEPNLPLSIDVVRMDIGAAGSGPSGTRTVRATADYTYTP